MGAVSTLAIAIVWQESEGGSDRSAPERVKKELLGSGVEGHSLKVSLELQGQDCGISGVVF